MRFGMNLLLWTGHVTTEHFPLFAKLKQASFDGVEVPLLFQGDEAHYKKVGQDPLLWPRSAGSWPGYIFTNAPLSLPAGHFGLGHGTGAHAPNEYYLIDSTNPKVAGIDGAAYLVGGFGMTALTANDIVLVPIRSGVGLRLGANVGYLKFTPVSTWNPF